MLWPDIVIMMTIKDIQRQNWYHSLVEECKAIVTEAVFTSRWALVEGYWNLGRRIREDQGWQKWEQQTDSSLQGLANTIGVSERTLYYALQAYDKYPTLDKIPEGKNVSWNKLITKYLPLPQAREVELTPQQKAKFTRQVIHGDCIKKLKDIKTATVDMVYVDPPYNVGKDDWDKQELPEYLQFTSIWIAECLRVLKEKAQFFIHYSSQKASWLEDYILTEFGLLPKSRIIWHYRNLIQGRSAKDKFLSTYQPILHYNIGGKPLNFPQEWTEERFDVWTIASPQSNFNEGKDHITQKPLELMERLIKYGSFKGELVLDPMAGSGTTGVAARKLERDYILIEREGKYINIIHKRLNELEERP